jgi:transcriptional regulator with XRE-family HTH domain
MHNCELCARTVPTFLERTRLRYNATCAFLASGGSGGETLCVTTDENIPDLSIFAQRLRELRAAAGYDQAQFGIEVAKFVPEKPSDYTQAAISKLELGRGAPSFRMLLAISEVLKCSLDYLCGLRDYPGPLPKGRYIVDCALYAQLRTGKAKLKRGQRWAVAVPDGDVAFHTPAEVQAMEGSLPTNYREKERPR